MAQIYTTTPPLVLLGRTERSQNFGGAVCQKIGIQKEGDLRPFFQFGKPWIYLLNETGVSDVVFLGANISSGLEP